MISCLCALVGVIVGVLCGYAFGKIRRRDTQEKRLPRPPPKPWLWRDGGTGHQPHPSDLKPGEWPEPPPGGTGAVRPPAPVVTLRVVR